MILKAWNVWHCYSSYFLRPFGDLPQVARTLVDSGLVEAAFMPDGTAWWRGANGTENDRIRIERRPYHAQATIELPSSMPRYAAQCAFESAWMAVNEAHLLEHPLGDAPLYVRAFLAQCTLMYEHFSVHLCPQLKLYDNDVLLTQFRILSGDRPYRIEQFVDEQVNLYKHVAKSMVVPPMLFRLYLNATWKTTDGSLSHRLANVRELRQLEVWASANSGEQPPGDFSSPALALDEISFGTPGGPTDPTNFRLLGEMVETAARQAISPARSSLRYVLTGPKPRATHFGDYWSGRPSVYIIAFNGQPTGSREVISGFKAPLAMVVTRTAEHPAATDRNIIARMRQALTSVLPRRRAGPTVQDPEAALGPNLRPHFDDYAVFLNSAVNLWVLSRRALSGRVGWPPDPNWNHVILDKQVQVEFIAYRHLSHRLLEQRSRQPHQAVKAIVEEERRLSLLHRSGITASSFGEIRDLVRHAEVCLGVDQLRDQVRENLRLRSLELAELRELNTRRFGWALTIVFGVGAASALARSLIEPLCLVTGYYSLPLLEWQVMSAFGAAVAVLLTLIAVAWWRTAGRPPSG